MTYPPHTLSSLLPSPLLLLLPPPPQFESSYETRNQKNHYFRCRIVVVGAVADLDIDILRFSLALVVPPPGSRPSTPGDRKMSGGQWSIARQCWSCLRSICQPLLCDKGVGGISSRCACVINANITSPSSLERLMLKH